MADPAKRPNILLVLTDQERQRSWIPPLGSMLRGAGYRTSYVGKWHLSHSNTPDMESYGFSDWTGDDRLYMGLSGTALEFDPDITGQATRWLAKKPHESPDPWFLT